MEVIALQVFEQALKWAMSPDRIGNLRQRAAKQGAVASGKMTFGNVPEVYRKRLHDDISLKPRTKTYREERIAALLKSWPSIKDRDGVCPPWIPPRPAGGLRFKREIFLS
jgi:hypothetical protein